MSNLRRDAAHSSSIPGGRGRILFLTQTHNIWGGIESWFDGLTAWLQRRGWDVHVGLARGALYNDPQKFLSAHPQAGTTTIMNASSGTEEARVESILRAWISCSPDVVVPVALGSVFTAARRAKLRGSSSRLVIPVHSLHTGYLQNVLANFDVVDQVAGVSWLIQRFFLQRAPQESSRVHYIRNGVAPAALVRRRDDERGPLRVGFVGRLDNSSKRVLDLIPLYRSMCVSEIPIRFHIVGKGSEENSLRRNLEGSTNRNCSVKFHGYLSHEELYKDIYPALDVLLLFSPTEGSPLTLYEAMHHGVVPLVSRFLGCASEGVVRDNENALTFTVGDVETAAKHLRQLATDRKLLDRLGAQARNDVVSYEEEQSWANWEHLFTTSLEYPARIPARTDIDRALTVPTGRLERWGLSPATANSVRNALRRRFDHKTGFEEWPGSQPATESELEEIQKCLTSIDTEASALPNDSMISGKLFLHPEP